MPIDGYEIKFFYNLLLVESTPSSTCIGAIIGFTSTNKYMYAIYQIEPTFNKAFVNYFQVMGDFLESGLIFVRNSGIRNGLESSNLIILYKKTIYIWDWKSGYSHAILTHHMDTLIEDSSNFSTISETESVFLIM
jgi:hypothetical protein